MENGEIANDDAATPDDDEVEKKDLNPNFMNWSDPVKYADPSTAIPTREKKILCWKNKRAVFSH